MKKKLYKKLENLKKNNNAEDIHQFRIFLRRLRVNYDFNHELKELFKSAGSIRDLDMYISYLDSLGIEALKEYITSLIKIRKELVKNFLNKKYSNLLLIPKRDKNSKLLFKNIDFSNKDSLHKLRKRVKLIRYKLESEKKDSSDYKKLQDILGDIHDDYNYLDFLNLYKISNEEIENHIKTDIHKKINGLKLELIFFIKNFN